MQCFCLFLVGRFVVGFMMFHAFSQIPRGNSRSMARSEYWASELSAGTATVCAVLERTTLKCWGNADYQKLPGQWGDESGEMGTSLPSIDLGVTVHDVAVSNHICALLSDGAYFPGQQTVGSKQQPAKLRTRQPRIWKKMQ